MRCCLDYKQQPKTFAFVVRWGVEPSTNREGIFNLRYEDNYDLNPIRDSPILVV